MSKRRKKTSKPRVPKPIGEPKPAGEDVIKQARVDRLEESGWTAHKPICGLTITEAAAKGDPVDVAIVGSIAFDYPGTDGACNNNIGVILTCATALGIKPPGDQFLFSGGQVFYRDGKLEEVRLSGRVPGTVTTDGVESGTWIGWSTDPPPRLDFNPEDESFHLRPEDAERTHLSATVVEGPRDPDKPDELRLAVVFLWDLRGNQPENLRGALREGAPEQGSSKVERTFPLSFGPTRIDSTALDFLNHAHKLRLPRRWSTIPRWEDLERGEIERLEEEFGETAFEDHRDRPALLSRRTARDGREQLQLTEESARQLKIRNGLGNNGYIDRDADTGEELLVRLFEAGRGHVEIGLSWFGKAGPFTEEWRRNIETQAEAAAAELQRERQLGVLPFEELEREQEARVDRLLQQARLLNDGRRAMEMVLGQVGRQLENPVVIPAEAWRVLFGLEDNPHWKSRVEASIQVLRACSFRLRTFDLDRDIYGYGNFLSEWWFVGRGRGSHGDGDYYLQVSPRFVGCIDVFESGRRKLPNGLDAVTYDFGKELSLEEKESQGWTARSGGKTSPSFYRVFDAGRPFYNAAAGLSGTQDSLVSFIERELTLNRDTPAKLPETGKQWCKKAPRDAPEAGTPRAYDRRFCPLLPDGQVFFGALGHFTRNPEAGRTLYGTRRREGKSGGAHSAGLLQEMGHWLSSGANQGERLEVVRTALEDIRAVVVDYLEGFVAARGPNDEWLTAEEAQRLPIDDLLRVRWFFFVPTTWLEDRRRKWEQTTSYRATESEAEARRVRDDRTAIVPSSGRVGLENSPLRARLYAARTERGLSQAAVAQLFGVGQRQVSKWELGTDPDPETGKVPGAPIPEELVPLVLRWVETGEPPSAEELAARRARRGGA